jgi:transcriptional regulator with XRE-family HTH domain
VAVDVVAKPCLVYGVQISERIKRWRESRGITKAELARRIGVSSAAMTYFELDESDEDHANPSVETVEKIAKALDVTTSEFFDEPPSKRRAKAS